MTITTIPKLSGDIRHLIPKLGLRNYWYPAIADRSVGARKPVKVSLLGEELCLFRGANGAVAAIQDVCPHRGARLSEGDCHYRGTVACPYHGWVFDESGKNVAVLSEGPDSGVCGKPGSEAKVYPTHTLKGLVFVWMGDGEAAPIEEDVPEEFFDPDALVQVGLSRDERNGEHRQQKAEAILNRQRAADGARRTRPRRSRRTCPRSSSTTRSS